MSDYLERVREDARLIILKALAAQTDERLHSGYLVEELFHFGVDWTCRVFVPPQVLV